MKRRFIVYPFKLLASLLCTLCFAIVAAAMVAVDRIGAAWAFGAFGLVYLVPAALSGMTVELNTEGVQQSLLGLPLRRWRWDEIAEIGVVGTKVFNPQHPEKTGALQLYFSRQALTEEQRFELALKWPPLDKIYMVYDQKRGFAVQLYWSGKIETYNTGDLRF